MREGPGNTGSSLYLRDKNASFSGKYTKPLKRSDIMATFGILLATWMLSNLVVAAILALIAHVYYGFSIINEVNETIDIVGIPADMRWLMWLGTISAASCIFVVAFVAAGLTEY